MLSGQMRASSFVVHLAGKNKIKKICQTPFCFFSLHVQNGTNYLKGLLNKPFRVSLENNNNNINNKLLFAKEEIVKNKCLDLEVSNFLNSVNSPFSGLDQIQIYLIY